MKVEQMVEKLSKAKDMYDETGETLMSDAEYDALIKELKEIDPKNAFLKRVGTTVNEKNKVKHSTPMLSCEKLADVDEIIKWKEKIGLKDGELIAEGKVDGGSCSLVYKDGKLIQMATRGDSEWGHDVLKLAKFIQGIPKSIKLSGTIDIRGEFVIYEGSEVINPNNSSMRSLCNGVINSKTLDEKALTNLSQVHFVGYQVLNSEMNKESEKIDWLKNNGFETVEYVIVNTKEQIQKYYDKYIAELRSKWKYLTDGLVVICNNSTLHESIDAKYTIDHAHKFCCCIKPPFESAETELIDVDWSVSRLNTLVPIAIFKTVNIGSSNINKCTLCNFEYAEKLHLHKHDVIEISKRNQVIPHLESVKTQHKEMSKDLIPTKCPCCGTKLERQGIHLICPAPLSVCKDKLVDTILHYVVALEMDGLSYSFVKTLVDAGKLKSIKGLYDLKAEDFAGIEGFGSRKITNALEQIEKSKNINIQEMGKALGIPLIGIKGLKKLNVNTADEFLNFSGSGSVIAENLKTYIKEHKKEIEELISVLNIGKIAVRKKGNGRNVCFSGCRPHSPEEFAVIEKNGDNIVDGVNKDTQLLVVKDINTTSSKKVKAEKLNIEVKSYEQYFK